MESIKNQNQGDLRYTQLSAIDLEEIVLGAILIERDAFSLVDSILKPEHFHLSSNRVIYEAANSLFKNQEPIDAATVTVQLLKSKNLDSAGGALRLAELTSKVGSSAHIKNHALIIKQQYFSREMLDISQKTSRRIIEGEDIDDVMVWHDKVVESLQEEMIGEKSTLHVFDSVRKSLRSLAERVKAARQGKHTGIPTGLKQLDSITNGWQNSEVIVIAARPAMGKTAFALHFAKSAAVNGFPVAIFSLEMSDESLADRLLISESGVDANNYKSGRMSQKEQDDVEKAANKFTDLPMYIDDNASVSMSYIRSKARLLHKQGKCRMVIIDYLQLVTEGGEKGRNREQEVSQMSREAKILAKELNIPVLLLSQLNRKVEDRGDKRPLLADLRESGAIEQDADMVCFIHRPEYYKISMKDKNGFDVANGIEFLISKYRNGATGDIQLQHNGSLSRIYDIGAVSSDLPF